MKSTVILVHGTFAAPKKGANWYQPQKETTASPNFVARLDVELARRGAVARCWAHLPEGEAVFHWSGNNSWTDRAEAARFLADYVDELHRKGWKCQIVAHSHGGNVAVEALPHIARADRDSSARAARRLVAPKEPRRRRNIRQIRPDEPRRARVGKANRNRSHVGARGLLSGRSFDRPHRRVDRDVRRGLNERGLR
jgi:hypothetical protein